MAATIYSAPEGLEAPDFADFDLPAPRRFDAEAYQAACQENRKALAKWCRENSDTPHSKVVGEVIRFPVADGAAEYMVYTTKPLRLIHLDYFDGYQADPILLKGLDLSDVRELVAREKGLAEIFGRKGGD